MVLETHRAGQPIFAIPFNLIVKRSLMHVVVNQGLFVIALGRLFTCKVAKEILFLLESLLLELFLLSIFPSPAIAKRNGQFVLDFWKANGHFHGAAVI